MFKNAFETQLAKFTDDSSLINTLWEEIRRQYSKPSRHYHSLQHLDNLFAELVAIREQIVDWDIMVFSIAYHDIIYNTIKTDNEEKSAEYALIRLTQLSLPPSQKDKCLSQILATKGHNLSEDSDTNFFIDADLAILGASEDVYREYSMSIRKEYRFYPDVIYKPGRKKVLKHFLEMSAIYKTAYFQEKYETKARLNLRSELDSLSA